jgi:hypothetical protein
VQELVSDQVADDHHFSSRKNAFDYLGDAAHLSKQKATINGGHKQKG